MNEEMKTVWVYWKANCSPYGKRTNWEIIRYIESAIDKCYKENGGNSNGSGPLLHGLRDMSGEVSKESIGKFQQDVHQLFDSLPCIELDKIYEGK